MFQRLDDLELEASELWPVHPELIGDYRSWLDRASDLIAEAERDPLRSQLTNLKARASAFDGEGQPVFDLQEDRWWYNQLLKLIDALEAFEDPRLGSIAGISPRSGPGVQRRLDAAIELRDGFAEGGAFRRRWEQAAGDLVRAYPGVEIPIQVGLVPIGPDLDSGLWEFWHVGSGAEPTRGADGRWAVSGHTGVVLVLIPGGRFHMGAQADDPGGRNYDPRAGAGEGPVHPVVLSPYFISKYELTQGQWHRMTGRSPSYYRQPSAGPEHPVEQVSWEDCVAVLSWFDLSLPSEAQWEHAARAGTDTAWWTGADRGLLSVRGAANLADRAARRAGYNWSEIEDWPELDDGWPVHAPVDALAPNPFGLHHVHGNVWEWCADGYDPAFYASSPSSNPLAPTAGVGGRVNRGGSFFSTSGAARISKRALRVDNAPTSAASNLGVRPARELRP